jgi:hypothetical protein
VVDGEQPQHDDPGQDRQRQVERAAAGGGRNALAGERRLHEAEGRREGARQGDARSGGGRSGLDALQLATLIDRPQPQMREAGHGLMSRVP